jgi:hypothetical protein
MSALTLEFEPVERRRGFFRPSVLVRARYVSSSQRASAQKEKQYEEIKPGWPWRVPMPGFGFGGERDWPRVAQSNHRGKNGKDSCSFAFARPFAPWLVLFNHTL